MKMNETLLLSHASPSRSNHYQRISWSDFFGVRLPKCWLSSQHIERMLKVSRIGALKLYAAASSRVHEAQSHGVQPLPFQPEAGSERGVSTIHGVAHAWMPLRRHMHSNL